MAQSTITNFYNSRKRPAFDELKGKSKVMALESGITETGYNDSNSVDNAKQTLSRIGKESTVFSTAEVSKLKPQKVITRASRTTRTPAKNGRRTTKPKELKQPNLKSFLLSKEEDTSSSAEGQVQVDLPIAKNQSDGPGPNVDSEDSIEVKEESSTSETLVKNLLPERAPGEVVAVSSDLSSNIENFRANESSLTVDVTENQNMKVSSSISHGIKSEQSRSSNANVTSNDNTDSVCRPVTNEKPASTQSINDKLESIRSSERKETSIEKARRELSLGDIKSKLTRSARLAELKASLTRFDEGREKLKQISKVKQDDKPVGADGPQLNQFNAIELEVPISPSKSPMKSPMKSPLKNLIGSRSPAFQRYSSLAQSGIPSLTLPNSYRHLAELFRCVDTVSSILFNRKEIITFRKLQKGVQEMSRKNFSPTHLAQIVTVLPDSYILKQEKVHNFGTPSKHDKYQLVIEPIIEPNQNGVMSSALSMTPSVLLERRRRFYSNILDIVKKHHHEFLLSLDPPLNVARQSLTRWHPEFAVDQVPEVVAATLPQPPNMEKCYTAKDVLAKARGLFSCNSRMEKALQSVAAQYNNNGLPSTDTIVSVEPPTNTNSQPATPAVNTQMSSALKGIPKALLEKIRARQAAKAMEAMTRTPAQCKEAAQYARLPELARILRNVFVVEKKGALPLETVIEKVGDSYRSALSPGELDHHIRLLAKSVPGWLTFEHLLNMDYLRLSKKADMNRVIQKLHDLANSKRGS